MSDSNADACQNAAIALVVIGDASTVAPLIKALDSRNDVVRRGAAYALGFLENRQAVPPLITRLTDRDAVVRQNAVDSLQRLNDRRALAPLRAIARSDPDETIRERARRATDAAGACAGRGRRGRARRPAVSNSRRESSVDSDG